MVDKAIISAGLAGEALSTAAGLGSLGVAAYMKKSKDPFGPDPSGEESKENDQARITQMEQEMQSNNEKEWEARKRSEQVRKIMENSKQGKPPLENVELDRPAHLDDRIDWSQIQDPQPVSGEPVSDQWFSDLANRNDPGAIRVQQDIQRAMPDLPPQIQQEIRQGGGGFGQFLSDYLLNRPGSVGRAIESMIGVIGTAYREYNKSKDIRGDPSNKDGGFRREPEPGEQEPVAKDRGGLRKKDPKDFEDPDKEDEYIPLHKIQIAAHCTSQVFIDPITKKRTERITCIDPETRQVRHYTR